MAYGTVDFAVRPEDGWVLVATAPDAVIVRPVEHHPWWLAVSADVPAAGVEGMKFGRGGDGLRETFSWDVPITGNVYIRIKEPPASNPSSHMHFCVISDVA